MVWALSEHCEISRSPVARSISHRSSPAAGPLHTALTVTIVQSSALTSSTQAQHQASSGTSQRTEPRGLLERNIMLDS